MNYRADVDGLRAIAVLFVLLFHAGLKPFISGFIGVDIFFVISGFLITGIIHKSLQEDSFSFIVFYKNRLWRLQPVFICLMVFTILLCLLLYLPEDLIHYSKSLRKTVLFISNNYFARETTAYFADDNSLLPLLHTWSLSVEWQGYLILPLLIYSIYLVVDKAHLSKIFYGLTLLFLGITLYESTINSGKTYYQLSSRLFEFLIGSCVFFNQNNRSLNKHFLNFISGLALITLIYIAVAPQVSSGFPNIYALILCIATAILIFCGSQSNKSVVTQLLSKKPVVFVGLLSYSLYIWHWPVLVFMRYLGIEETNIILFCAFILIFILAYASWRFIEKPMRQFKTHGSIYSFICLFLTPLVLIHLGDFMIKANEGYPQRFNETVRINAQLNHYVNPLRKACLHDEVAPLNLKCVLGSKGIKSKKGFMFGDSHSNHYWGFIDTLAQQAKISILADSMSACLALPNISLLDWNKKTYTACKTQTEYYYDHIKSSHYDFVILSQNWEGYLVDKLVPNQRAVGAKEQIEQALDEALQQIISSGAKPVLIKAIAPGNAYRCFFNHIKQRKTYNPKLCDFKIGVNNYQWQNDLFMRMKNKYSQLIVIDPKKEQCRDEKCLAAIKDLPLFRDEGHLNDYASYYLAQSYLTHYKNPLS